MPIITDPKKIQAKSFQIIERHLKGLKLPDSKRQVIRRAIHATADLDLSKELMFHRGAIDAGISAIKNGKNIIADANMVKAGINKRILGSFGGKVICLLDDKEVISKSSKLNITRSILAMRKSKSLMNNSIVAIGNAPTALFELCDLIRQSKARPALVVGVPIGFVGAVESKKMLRKSNVPYITNNTRKGGSSMAASIVNALLIIAQNGQKGGQEGQASKDAMR